RFRISVTAAPARPRNRHWQAPVRCDRALQNKRTVLRLTAAAGSGECARFIAPDQRISALDNKTCQNRREERGGPKKKHGILRWVLFFSFFEGGLGFFFYDLSSEPEKNRSRVTEVRDHTPSARD